MARKTKADERAAKEKKQKKIAAVGGVLLLIIMGVQVPRTMKMMKDDTAAVTPPAATTTAAATPTPAAGAPTDPLAPPTLATANPTAPEASAPAGASAVAGQLISFSHFASKDPFQQQINPEAVAEAKADKPADTEKTDETLEPDGGAEADANPASSGGQTYTGAHLAVNGVEESVSVNATFPQATPTFVLVTVGAKSAKIKVAEGGSFAAGDATLSLELKKPVTLVNTADGTRYVLELKSVP